MNLALHLMAMIASTIIAALAAKTTTLSIKSRTQEIALYSSSASIGGVLVSGVTEDRITKWLFGEGSLGSLSTFVSMMQQFFRELGVMILLFTLFALIFKFIQYRTENSQETEDPGLTDAAIAPDDQQAS